MSQDVTPRRQWRNCATAARRSGGGGKQVGPLLHERLAALEHTSATAGGFDAIAHTP